MFPFDPNGIDYGKLVGHQSEPMVENEIEARDKEIERSEFSIAFKRIGEMLSAEKENAFFKFYSNDGTKPWDRAAEDTTAYYIWREAFQRSRNDEVSTIIDQYDGEKPEAADDTLFTEEINDWIDDPDCAYFDLDDPNIELEFVDEIGPDFNDNRKIHVIDDTLIVEAPAQNYDLRQNTFEPEAKDIEPQELSTFVCTTALDFPEAKDTEPQEESTRMPNGNVFTTALDAPIQKTSPMMPEIYNLQTSDACPVNDIFLKCLNPKPSESKVDETEVKFSVPRIKGKTCLHFSIPFESHYIDIHLGTSVVTSKFHREYVGTYKEKHELAEQRRSDKKAKHKPIENPNATETIVVPNRRTKAKKYKFVLTDTPSEDEEAVRKPTKKAVRKPRKRSKPIVDLDRSFSSDISVVSKPRKKRSCVIYSTDEN